SKSHGVRQRRFSHYFSLLVSICQSARASLRAMTAGGGEDVLRSLSRRDVLQGLGKLRLVRPLRGDRAHGRVHGVVLEHPCRDHDDVAFGRLSSNAPADLAASDAKPTKGDAARIRAAPLFTCSRRTLWSAKVTRRVEHL